MSKQLKILLALSLFTIMASPVFASDWDIAGKVLTGIEGLRIISGGNIDIIGAFIGANNGNYRHDPGYRKYHRNYDRVQEIPCQREWVPTYAWVERWVRGHEEYDPYTGRTIFIEGHYVTYKVETGGYWVYKRPYRSYSYNCGY
jgi:hypothetical protein